MNTKTIASGVAHKVPEDLRKVLLSDTKLFEIWQSLTPLARNEWICWMISVKREETRTEHLHRMIEELKDGMRRPCCWYGCIHRKDKAVSPSIQALVVNKQRKSR
jgi:hypothetical protein